jgi:hypothetical protein
MERAKEKARKARIPLREKLGMSSHLVERPLKANPIILNPGIIIVTIYKATTLLIHLKKPNVRRFKGISKMLIIGLTRSVVTINPNPAKRSPDKPFSMTIPWKNRVTR